MIPVRETGSKREEESSRGEGMVTGLSRKALEFWPVSVTPFLRAIWHPLELYNSQPGKLS